MHFRIFTFFFLAASLISEAGAQQLMERASGLTRPLFLTHSGDGSGRLFIVEQEGRIKILRDGQVLAVPFLDISNRVALLTRPGDERGLLGLAFHPDFADNRRFFIYYSLRGQSRTVLAEYQASEANPDVAFLTERVLLSFAQPFENHNGGMLAFGPDGMLYVALGDGGGAGDPDDNGQDKDTLLGSLLRLDVDIEGFIPPDNPFVGAEGRDEIFAYGLRNPWRFSFDRETGRLFLGDVGQNRFEEVNLIEAGGNYGWNTMEADRCFSPALGCSMAGLELPIHSYPRSDGVSVTGGYVYRGQRLPNLQGAYIFGDFGSGRIWALREEAPGDWRREVLFGANSVSLASFGEGPDGELFVIDLFGGRVLQIDSPDSDGDGATDAQEDAGPNQGDSNLDGIPDREQGNVIHLTSDTGGEVVLTAEEDIVITQAGFVDNPSPEDAPQGVRFPLGFLSFQLNGLEPGGETSVTIFINSVTADQEEALTAADLNGYYRFGPTPDNPQPHWFNFEFDGQTGAVFGTHSVTLRFVDGQRGDDDLTADGIIVDAGGCSFDPEGPRQTYFAQVADGAAGDIRFQTSLTFINADSQEAQLQLDFFQSDGSGMNIDLGEAGSGPRLDFNLSRGRALFAGSAGVGDPQAQLPIIVGYARARAGRGVGGTLIFRRTDVPSGAILYETGLAASSPVSEFTISYDLLKSRNTGLAIVNPPEAEGPLEGAVTQANLTLRLYDPQFIQLLETTFALNDGQHISSFIDEFFPEDLALEEGSLTVSSDRPLAVITLRQDDAAFIEFPDEVPTLTTFPVIPGRADQKLEASQSGSSGKLKRKPR